MKKQGQVTLGNGVQAAVGKLCLQQQPYSEPSVLMAALPEGQDCALFIGESESSQRSSDVPKR